jgi:hypothetical protein
LFCICSTTASRRARNSTRGAVSPSASPSRSPVPAASQTANSYLAGIAAANAVTASAARGTTTRLSRRGAAPGNTGSHGSADPPPRSASATAAPRRRSLRRDLISGPASPRASKSAAWAG